MFKYSEKMEKNFTDLFHKLQHENLRPEQLELLQQ